MSKFKEFLKLEVSPGMVAPTLNAGDGWRFPSSPDFNIPTTAMGLAQKRDMYEKPMFQALQRAQYLVQNIVSKPSLWGVDPRNITGSPQVGGMISGINRTVLDSRGASRGLKFLPAEFNLLQTAGVFVVDPRTPDLVSIDLKKLYDKLKNEIGEDVGKGIAANAYDKLVAGAVTPGQHAQTLQRSQYGI